jgi:cell division protein FtsB
LVGLLFLLWPLLGENGLATYFRLRKQRDLLRSEVEQFRATGQGLQAEIDSLQTSPARLEQIAREDHFMRRPGETVYEVVQDNQAPGGAP